jgi:hypothetical protein
MVYPREETKPEVQLISKKRMDKIKANGDFMRLSHDRILIYEAKGNGGYFFIVQLLISGEAKIVEQRYMPNVVQNFHQILEDKQKKEPTTIL